MTKKAKKSTQRLSRGKIRDEKALFPIAVSRAKLPREYAALLKDLKARIAQTRLRTVLSANAEMILLYWDIGRRILDRQKQEGWGAKTIDRLAQDLKKAFPDMSGFSLRNLKYMRAFAQAWTDKAIVQEPLAQLPWYHHIIVLTDRNDLDNQLFGSF